MAATSCLLCDVCCLSVVERCLMCCCLVFAVRCSLFVVGWCGLVVVCCLLLGGSSVSVVDCRAMLFAVCCCFGVEYLLRGACCLSVGLCCLLFGTCCVRFGVLYVVCCMLFVVR